MSDNTKSFASHSYQLESREYLDNILNYFKM